MALIVQKYGGTSVGSIERIKNVAARVADYHRRGHKLVVVVSAMSGVTDQLINMAKEITPLPSERELDLLLATGEQQAIALTAIALQAIGVPAIALTGAQAGIVTDGVHTKARIRNVTPKKVHELLNSGHVVIVAGFQGETPEGDVTTLGRGGSDLTAVALAAALKADLCQIYTDVDGVYTADPRIVPNAKKLDEISYDEMLELASLGAKVMQSRSVEFAKKFGVVFEVRSSFNDNPGTIVKEETKSMEAVVVRGVALDKKQAKVTIVGVPDKPGVAARIFKALADAAINVDMIVQNVSHGAPQPTTDISFTIEKADLPKAQKVITTLKQELGFAELIATENIGKLSIVGVGMKSHTGVAAKMFEALARIGVNIDMISTSEIKISVVIDAAKAEQAAREVHAAFIG
ncbi:MAG: aspartate kinase [Verrucomicrobiae bacterium]|nr:aspartate kinase [Verrucomicrobiae bacterium]MCX7723035.1 aspartate kinase [Verrucomicrobiae bacterium]MDW7979468.1 aspartate kinase [Verrucomicrobiales bacterium]